jgi:SAM-dependent methyltransferase
VNRAALRHARRIAQDRAPKGRLRLRAADLRSPLPRQRFDAALLIYYVLEAFPRAEQPAILRNVASSLKPGAVFIAEMRLQPDQPPGRIEWWDVVPRSLLSDRPHLLLGDTTYDRRRNLYVLREVAVLDDGRIAVQQTSAWLCPFDRIPALFRRAGLTVERVFDGWTTHPGGQLSESVLVVARR